VTFKSSNRHRQAPAGPDYVSNFERFTPALKAIQSLHEAVIVAGGSGRNLRRCFYGSRSSIARILTPFASVRCGGPD